MIKLEEKVKPELAEKAINAATAITINRLERAIEYSKNVDLDADLGITEYKSAVEFAKKNGLELGEISGKTAITIYTNLMEVAIKSSKDIDADPDSSTRRYQKALEFIQELMPMESAIEIDLPYNTKLGDEVKLYEEKFTNMEGKHFAPHSLEVAALWAVLTRLEDAPSETKLSRIDKARLYNGEDFPPDDGYDIYHSTDLKGDFIQALKDKGKRDGLYGISQRYMLDKLSQILNKSDGCINPFMVLRELEKGLQSSPLHLDKEVMAEYRQLISDVKQEYTDILKNNVRKALCADEDALKRLCAAYTESARAYIEKRKILNKFTHKKEAPSEKLMRSVEEKIDVSEAKKRDFRIKITNDMARYALGGINFDYRSNERLHRALELKLFEDSKDSIKVAAMVSDIIDKETQKKIEVVKNRLIDKYGYCEHCAKEVITYVASIFARER